MHIALNKQGTHQIKAMPLLPAKGPLIEQTQVHEVALKAFANHQEKDTSDIDFKGKKVSFPPSLASVKVINPFIGGSTGAKLVQDTLDPLKTAYVQKTTGDKIKPDHLSSEYYTNLAYKALGVKVPEVALYDKFTGQKVKDGQENIHSDVVMLSKYIPGNTVELSEYLQQKSPKDILKVQRAVQRNFVADCLLANWDVVGLFYDNIRIDVDTHDIWRVDNGSGLEYRAQEEKKGTLFGDKVIELNSLRSNINPQAEQLFGTIENSEIVRQIDEILPKRKELLAAIPQRLKGIVEKRLDYLQTYKEAIIS